MTMQVESTGEPVYDATHPDPRRWRALMVIAISQLMVVLDGSIVNLALPSAKAALGISDANQQWVLTAYTLTFGGLLLLGGRVADYLGRKRMFMVGLSGFALASALGGLAPTAGALYAARGLQGIFAALLAPAALSLVTVTFHDPKERARAFGVYGAISGGGAAVGLLLGGVLTEYLSWRWCLFINVPIALLAVLLAVGNVRESRATRTGGFDIPGALTVTIGLIALVYGFTKAAPHGIGAHSNWTDPATLTWFAVAAVLLIAFFVIENRTSNPLAADACPARAQPRRLLPRAAAGRSGDVRHVPVPRPVPAGDPRVLAGQGRVRVPSLQRRHHPRSRHRQPAPAAARAEAARGAGPRGGRPGHALADPARGATRPTSPTSSRRWW